MTAATGPNVPPTRPVVTVHLQKIPLLAGVDEQTLAQVAAALQLRTVERGRNVLQKGSVGEHLMFVLSGRLQVVDLTEEIGRASCRERV